MDTIILVSLLTVVFGVPAIMLFAMILADYDDDVFDEDVEDDFDK